MEEENVEETSFNENPEELESTGSTNESEEVVDNTQNSAEEDTRFTQEQMNKIIESRLARKDREYEKRIAKYEDLVSTLKAGMGKDTSNVDELNTDLKNFYKEQGVEIPEIKRELSEKEQTILAKAEAQEIIDSGDDEVNRIATEIMNKPASERTTREKILLDNLASHAVYSRAKNELKSKNIDTSILDNDSFKTFASQFSANTPITNIYDMYTKVNNVEVKERPASTGSTKTISNTNQLKDFYTEEEASKFTQEELLRNPKLLDRITDSMSKW